MVRLVSLLSHACVSVPGLMFVMLLILRVNIRFLHEIGYFPSDIGGIDPDRFHDVTGPLGVRMITVGVLLLERHDVLEIAGVVPKGSERDALSRLAHPFGIFFLVFGLFLECAIEQVHLPARLLDPSVGFTIVVWVSYIIAVISLLAVLRMLMILVQHWRRPLDA